MDEGNQTIHQLKPNCPTKLSTSYFIFYGKIALMPISYLMEMFAVETLVTKMSMANMLMEK